MAKRKKRAQIKWELKFYEHILNLYAMYPENKELIGIQPLQEAIWHIARLTSELNA